VRRAQPERSEQALIGVGGSTAAGDKPVDAVEDHDPCYHDEHPDEHDARVRAQPAVSFILSADHGTRLIRRDECIELAGGGTTQADRQAPRWPGLRCRDIRDSRRGLASALGLTMTVLKNVA
jgi:hypothetical protein